MNLIQISFLIFVFMKQFYMFSSGGLQIGDLFFVLSFALYIHNTKNKIKFKIERIDAYLLIFVYLALIINLIYYTIYDKKEFIMSSFHYVYSFMIVILFRQLINEQQFIKKLVSVLKLNLIVQFLIYIIGLGRYFIEIRYMGTFNDPNQFGFFIYITMMLIVITSYILNKSTSFVYYLIAWILIFESSSTGMLLGISIFTVLSVLLKSVNKIKEMSKFTKLKKYKSITIRPRTILILGLIILIYTIIIEPNSQVIKDNLEDTLILNRVEEKINEFFYNEDEEKVSLIEDRGIDKLLLYPEQMILGAGQGNFGRFSKTHHSGEIHSTLPSILFCYGVIPTILVIIWLFNNIRNIPLHMNAIYISLLVESFTLLNQRQPFFWMLFVLGSICVKKKKENYIIRKEKIA